MASVARRLEDHFEFASLGTSWRNELLGGATTFLTMSYIVFVNPSILADAGVPFAAAMAATCVAAAFGCLLMGLWARHPVALAPGMGINAYFAYGVVGGMGVDWRTALGAVFLSGILFLLLSLAGVRQRVFEAMPRELYAAVAAGIGLFLALIGLRNAGLIAPSDATMVTLGDLSNPAALLAVAGLLGTAALMARRLSGAILIGVLAVTALAAVLGLTAWNPLSPSLQAMTAAAGELDIPGAVSLGLLEVVFVFLFVDFFDTLGTVIAVSKKAGLADADGRIPRVGRLLTVDAASTVVGSLAGTSTVTSYIESAAGVAAGGRSGASSTFTGLLFLAALPLAPLVGAVPSAATAPALIIVGCMMMSTIREVDFNDDAAALPAFLTVIAIPLTYSIANGLAIGVIAYDALKLLTGRGREVSWLVHALAVLFLVRFAYLAAG